MHAVNGVAVLSLGLRLVFLATIVLTLLLIMAGDVETNPGPQTAGEQCYYLATLASSPCRQLSVES